MPNFYGKYIHAVQVTDGVSILVGGVRTRLESSLPQQSTAQTR